MSAWPTTNAADLPALAPDASSASRTRISASASRSHSERLLELAGSESCARSGTPPQICGDTDERCEEAFSRKSAVHRGSFGAGAERHEADAGDEAKATQP